MSYIEVSMSFLILNFIENLTYYYFTTLTLFNFENVTQNKITHLK